MKKLLVIFSVLGILSLLAVLSACNISSWSTYTNATYGFQLQYPPGGSLVTDTPTSARIQLPIEPDTNLAEKYLDISVQEDVSPCLSPQAAGWAPSSLTPTTETYNGLEFTVVSAGEGAAGSYYAWTGYSTVNGSICVSLTFVMHSLNPDAYDSPPPTFDEPAETVIFPLIVDTFTWLDPTPLPEGGWLTYTNLAYGFQLQYPAGGAGLLPGDTAVFAHIDLPITPGTSLMEKYLAIEVSTDGDPCGPVVGPGDPTPVPGLINGLEWLRQVGSDGAAGSMYLWTRYSTLSGIVCVKLNFILHSASSGVEPTPPPDYDVAAEKAVFLQIVETFIWLDGAAVTPTLVPTYTPTDTPTPVAFFFVPDINAYCRLGPDPIFEAPTLAMRGESYPIDGRNLLNTWLRIMVQPDLGCWVPRDAGTPSGDTSLVRVLYAIPTPTFTPPPFNCAQFTNEKTCDQHSQCIWDRACENK